MHSDVPRNLTMDPSASQDWDRALALTMGQLKPRQSAEQAEPLPIAETQELDWDAWCAAEGKSVPEPRQPQRS